MVCLSSPSRLPCCLFFFAASSPQQVQRYIEPSTDSCLPLSIYCCPQNMQSNQPSHALVFPKPSSVAVQSFVPSFLSSMEWLTHHPSIYASVPHLLCTSTRNPHATILAAARRIAPHRAAEVKVKVGSSISSAFSTSSPSLLPIDFPPSPSLLYSFIEYLLSK